MDSFHSHSYCRLCAELTINFNIINVGSEGAKHTIHKKLDRINASTDFNDDVLPKTLCRECAIALENAYDFVLKIAEAQSKLHTIFCAPNFNRETDEDKEVDVTIDDSVKEEEEVKEEDTEEKEDLVSSDIETTVPEPIKMEIGNEDDVKDELSNVDDNYINNVSEDDFDDAKEGVNTGDSNGTNNLSGDVKEELNNDDSNNINYVSDNQLMFDADDPDCNVKEQTHTGMTDTAKNKKKTLKPKESVKSKRTINKETSNESSTEQSWIDYTWKCAICELQINSFDKLRIHTIQYHHMCNAFRCVDCNFRKLKLDKFLVHVRKHRSYLRVTCFNCNKRFPSVIDLNIHMAGHRTNNQTNTCPGCYAEFESFTDFKKHTSELYCQTQQRTTWTTETTTFVEKSTDKLTCLLCNKTFRNKSLLYTHVQKTHTREDKIRNHICERCGKCFTSKSILEEHIRRHDNVKPYECDMCNKSFVTKKEVRWHMGVHNNVKSFSCEQCGRCFRLRRQLTAHKIIHTDSLPYACAFCNKRFRFRTILNQHKRQHTGVKPYSCDICQRDFTNWPNYNKHMKRMHNLDMAKKKRTPPPDGLCSINSVTGEVPQSKEVLERKKEIMKRRVPQRKDSPVTDTTNPENTRSTRSGTQRLQ